MSWKAYREEYEGNFLKFTLEELGLPEFWVKMRRIGSYTPKEISELQQLWADRRFQYVAKKIHELVEQHEEIELTDEEREVRDVLALVDGEAPPASATERQTTILGYLIGESGLAKMNPITGIDIELIQGWNLTHPDTNELLPLPKDDMEVLMTLPSDVLWHIKEKLLELQEEIVPKKVKELLSSQSSEG